MTHVETANGTQNLILLYPVFDFVTPNAQFSATMNDDLKKWSTSKDC